MEQVHHRQLIQRYRRHPKGNRVVVLDIRDDYALMQPELVELLLRKVAPLLR